jgi:DNA polymerase III sliding clamp (beta) subunit (PCNA family)
MKFSISKDKLLEGLSTVQNVVSTRTTLPILSNVLLQASDVESLMIEQIPFVQNDRFVHRK